MPEANTHAALEVRAHLARRRLRRSDLAVALGVSTRTVSDFLGERRPWRLDELELVAGWLGLDLADLLPGKASAHCNGGERFLAGRGRWIARCERERLGSHCQE